MEFYLPGVFTPARFANGFVLTRVMLTAFLTLTVCALQNFRSLLAIFIQCGRCLLFKILKSARGCTHRVRFGATWRLSMSRHITARHGFFHLVRQHKPIFFRHSVQWADPRCHSFNLPFSRCTCGGTSLLFSCMKLVSLIWLASVWRQSSCRLPLWHPSIFILGERY